MTVKTYTVTFKADIVGKNPEHCDRLADYLEVDLESIIKDYFIGQGQDERFVDVYAVELEEAEE